MPAKIFRESWDASDKYSGKCFVPDDRKEGGWGILDAQGNRAGWAPTLAEAKAIMRRELGAARFSDEQEVKPVVVETVNREGEFAAGLFG